MSFCFRQTNADRTLRPRKRHTECAVYITCRGLTLVELLVVITILTMITAVTIPLMAPVTGARKVRESARLLATVLAQAQSRALATGRPVGVWIDRLEKVTAVNQPPSDRANQSIDLFLCETPPPYSGATSDAMALVTKSGNSFVVEMAEIPPGWVNRGDEIRFNYRGPAYRIVGVGPKLGNKPTHPDGSLTGANMEIFVPPPPYAQPPVNAGVPFQIFRQPMKTADEPVTLPIGAMVDLAYSGLGNGVEFSVPTPGNPLSKFQGVANGVAHIAGVSKPVLVMFGPSGKLASVHYAHRPPTSSQPVFDAVKAITPVYLLVGPTPSESGTAPPNFMNQDSVWVAVNPQSGLVTTGEVAIGVDYFAAGGVSSLQQNDYAKAIRDSRTFARSQQNMGGR